MRMILIVSAVAKILHWYALATIGFFTYTYTTIYNINYPVFFKGDNIKHKSGIDFFLCVPEYK